MPAKTRRFRYKPAGPFSLERTAGRLVRFEEVVNHYEKGTYRCLVPVSGKHALVTVTQAGPPSRAELHVEVRGVPAREAGERVLERVLGAHMDVRPFYRQFRADKLLAAPLRHSRGLRVSGYLTLWEALVTAIFSQQVNLTLAYGIRRELCEKYGRRARFDGTTYIAFPTAARVAKERLPTLQKLRLSRNKAAALQRLARLFASGELDENELAAAPDEEVIETLVAIKGIGRWTADTALMRGLQRPDAFPAGDLGVVKYLARDIFGRDQVAGEAEMRQLSERWKPYRSLALTYLYAEMSKRREQAT